MSNFNNFSNQYRYTLEKGSKKHFCPDCNKKTLVAYIDTETGDYLPTQYGRCDRESKCSYHLNPYSNGYAKIILEQEQKVTGVTKVTVSKQKYFRHQHKPQPISEPVFFDFDTFRQTLAPKRYEKNTFVQNLFYGVQFPFEVDDVTKVIQLYRLGTITNGYRTGAITFPFIDIKGNVRTVQVKQFDQHNHTKGTDFLHSIIEKHHDRNKKPLPKWLKAYTKQEKKVSCLFGEHLLDKYPNNPIALVEAPKTAVYGTLYFGVPKTPESLIWLAVYNKSSFSSDKLKVLQGRFVYVFPDLSKDGNTFREWETKALEYESQLPRTRFIFSDLLEQLAPEQDKNKGNDIADYLIKQDWRLFRKWNIQAQPKPPQSKKREKSKAKIDEYAKALPNIEIFKPEQVKHHTTEQQKNWNSDIAELDNYFASIDLPNYPIKLNEWSVIKDCFQFIESHFATVKANNGKRVFIPYLNRLKELKQFFENNKDLQKCQ